MGLLDLFTGGKAGEATDALKRAEQYFSSIATPTKEELTLPELQQYVQAGLMTPAQAQAYLQQSNAYTTANIPQEGTAAQIAAINQLAQVANAGAEGSPTQRAQVEQINQDAARNLAGQRGAIEQAAAARGVPVGMLQAALSSQQAGQGLQDAHMAALQAQGQNYQQALAAMAQGGALGGQLQGQQNAQSNQIAQAQNAMQQFNAANQQNASQYNAANQQAANAMNLANRQDIANQNTGLVNTRTQYNAQIPQQVFANAMAKAQGQAGAATNIGGLYQQQGEQNAGIAAGLLNTAANIFAPSASFMGMGVSPGGQGGAGGFKGGGAGAQSAPSGYSPNVAPNQYARLGYAYGGTVKPKGAVIEPYNEGGICMPDGGMVPGKARVPGDSLKNDTVNAKLSPGELVVPRTQVPNVLGMMAEREQSSFHPEDVATLLQAMRQLRGIAA